MGLSAIDSQLNLEMTLRFNHLYFSQFFNIRNFFFLLLDQPQGNRKSQKVNVSKFFKIRALFCHLDKENVSICLFIFLDSCYYVVMKA